ncbi:MAG TPA: hypothetical protein VMF29_04310, partial [Candidatus Edwardsbacteria bacterium]|nr:hypothetical protein [Candidatus Edwardsbacteria bacterium]
KGTSNGGRVKGLFCHDMFRSFKGRRGPHGAKEWLTAAAAAFTKVRQELKVFPVSARLLVRNGSLLLYLRDHGAAGPLTLRIEALSPQSPLKVKELALPPGTLDTTVTLGPRPQYGLASYRITWGSAAARDRIVLFKYFPEAYADQPFRSVQSFRAGGDVLIALDGDKAAQGQALEIGRAARGLGLVPNTVSKDSLVPDLKYKYPVLIVLTPDTLTSACLAALNGWPARPLVVSGARNLGKADCDYLDRFDLAAVTEAILSRLTVAPRRPKASGTGLGSASQ